MLHSILERRKLMKRKILTLVVLCITVLACVFGLIACGKTADTRDPQIVAVYETYKVYAAENGETPLSYEEWLKSIRGEDGVTPTIEIDGDGYWVINGTKTEYKAQPKDGKNGTNGENGKSAYEIWTDNGHTGSESDFLEWLKGQNGTNGSNGQNGENGVTPLLRINEATNYWEVSYDNGATYTSLNVKATGNDGRNGANGQNGENGRGIEKAEINSDGDLIITYTNGDIENAGNVVVKNPTFDENNKIVFKSFTVSDRNVRGKVSNDTETFYFNDEIEIKGNAAYTVYRDFDCQNEVKAKAVNLSVGDNTFYVLETCGVASEFYTVTVRRRPIYTVTFDTNGCSEVENQSIEEDGFAVDPEPTRNGYGYTWDYDFSTPITEDTTITATWQAIFTVSGNEITGLTDYGKTLSEILIPETIDETEITSIGNSAFYQCTTLESVTIPDSVMNIGGNAFYLCSSLKIVNIPNNITSLDAGTFYGCNALQYNEYDNAYYLGNDSNLYLVLVKAKSGSITSCLINENTRIIYFRAFWNCLLITNIIIPDNVTSVGIQAFYGCNSLTSITIPKNVTRIDDSVFFGCSLLTSVNIGNSVTSIGDYVFYDCKSLTEINFDGSVDEWNSIIKGDHWKDGVPYSCVIQCSDDNNISI